MQAHGAWSNPVTPTVTAAVTAGTTQTQAGATQLASDINNISTCATAGDAVKLPTAVAGAVVAVKNSGAQIAALYPSASDSIDDLAVNLSIDIPPGATVTLMAISATVWETTSDGLVRTAGVSFTEDGSGTSYTATVEIPAGAIVHDVGFATTVLWDGTSASLIVGDDDDPNGWFTATNLKATDLVVGEVLSAADDGTWGGNNGAYLTAAGRRGRVTAGVDSGWYYGAASEVIFLVTPGAADGSAGRSFGWVRYSVPTFVASTNV